VGEVGVGCCGWVVGVRVWRVYLAWGGRVGGVWCGSVVEAWCVVSGQGCWGGAFCHWVQR